ncbi:MAG: peptidase C1A papain [Bacteroidetes bacterium]|nr:MAG: peptidase C1A papain [Bacteroidota bacterium]
MPIRMTDDPDQQEEDSGGGFGGGSGGGSGLFGLLPLLLMLFRGPKGLIVLAIILVGGYFFTRGGCNTSSPIAQNVAKLATGGILDPRQFAKANIYESLADDDTKNPLPESANLQKFAPTVGDQGHQGSCVAWSSAYGARTVLEAGRTGQDPNSLRFSPAFLYNQIGLDNCDGSYIVRAMEFMTQKGSVPYESFPYTDQNCSKQPNQQLLSEAQQFRMRGANRLTVGDRTDQIDLRAIKENLSQGAPVVIGMMVGGSYMQPMMGQDVWNPTDEDRSMMGFGGHAQCVVGYDDAKYGGAFLIMNSWGPQWGNNGFAWVRYRDFRNFVREAYGLEPMQRVGAAAHIPLDCEIGLVQVHYDGKRTVAGDYVPLKLTGNNVFETVSPMQIGSKFKMEIKNSTECYVYVFGKETDGTSYTLFPYPRDDDPSRTKYSPFCGIAGYRLFPKNKSMTPDSIGKKDYMAVVISKDTLNWFEINKRLSQNPQQDYASRLNNVFANQLIRNVHFQTTPKGNMQFKTQEDNNGIVACVVEVDK